MIKKNNKPGFVGAVIFVLLIVVIIFFISLWNPMNARCPSGQHLKNANFTNQISGVKFSMQAPIGSTCTPLKDYSDLYNCNWCE